MKIFSIEKIYLKNVDLNLRFNINCYVKNNIKIVKQMLKKIRKGKKLTNSVISVNEV